jgi:hypothetical protein
MWVDCLLQVESCLVVHEDKEVHQVRDERTEMQHFISPDVDKWETNNIGSKASLRAGIETFHNS